MPIRRDLTFANPEGSQSGVVSILPIQRVLFLSTRRGIIFVKGLRLTEEKIIVRGVRLLTGRLGTSDFTGNLPFKKRPDQNSTGPNSDIRDTKSKLKKKCVTHWCGLKPKTFLREVTAPRIFVGLARAARRQIGNRRLGGCNRRPLEKITAFKFCLFGSAPSRESSFLKI